MTIAKTCTRTILSVEKERVKVWREAAARHNVSLSTWIRWACDLALASPTERGKRILKGPTGLVREDGVQL